MAATLGHARVYKVLLGSRAEVDTAAEHGAASALWIPVGKGHAQVCKMLLDERADVDKVRQLSSDGASPLLVSSRTVMQVCARYSWIVVRTSTKPHILRVCPPLYSSAYACHADVCKMLLYSRADVDKPSQDSINPLFVGASYGHKDICKMIF